MVRAKSGGPVSDDAVSHGTIPACSCRTCSCRSVLFGHASVGGSRKRPTLGGEEPPTTRQDRHPNRASAQPVLCNNFATLHPQPAQIRPPVRLMACLAG